jgi:hypothetical protein
MTDIFISYAARERERVRPLRDALQAEGWTVFWDEKVPAGKKWRDHIFENLQGARCVIVAWSATSVVSDWVREEAEYAKTRGVLLPVFLDAVDPPFGFREVQALNLNGWEGSRESPAFRALIDEIRAIAGAGVRTGTGVATPISGSPETANREHGEAPVARTRRGPVVVALLLTAAVAAGAVWYFGLRDTGAPDSAAPAGGEEAVSGAGEPGGPPGRVFEAGADDWLVIYSTDASEDQARYEIGTLLPRKGLPDAKIFKNRCREGDCFHNAVRAPSRARAKRLVGRAEELGVEAVMFRMATFCPTVRELEQGVLYECVRP